MNCLRAATKPSGVYCASAADSSAMTLASFFPANSPAAAATPAPSTAACSCHPLAEAMAWPAAIVSHETRFSLPCCCSATTSMVSGIVLYVRLRLLRNVQLLNLDLVRPQRGLNFSHRHLPQRLVLSLFDADQGSVAQLVDAALYSQHRRQRHLHMLEISRFQFALYLNATLHLFDLHDDGGVRPSQQFRQNHAGLRIAVIIGLQAGEDEVELLILDGSSECLGGVDGVERNEAGIFQMNGAVGSLGQRLAQYLLGAR